MGKIIWSPNEIEDVEKIANYISIDSPERASLFVLKLIKVVYRLESLPFSGRIIPEIGDINSREIIFSSYRIMYELSDDLVMINTIIHGTQNFDLL